MDRYVVTKSFMDRFTNKYYGVGSIYESNDEARAAELERGGYIAPENTEAASFAMQQGEEQKQADQNAKEVAKAHSEIQKNAEAKTVLNGKVVSISQAQKAEAAYEQQNNQTGIQAHHDNSSESVQAGQVAKNSSLQQATQQTIRESEKQSGQQHLEQAMNASGGSTQNNAFVGSGMQQGYEGTATPATTASQMQAEEAAKTAQAAAEAKAKTARTKKEQ